MQTPNSPDESARLAAVRKYYIADQPLDAALDRITTLAARLFSVPIACVTLIDEHRLRFKSVYGLDVKEMPRELAICHHTIRSSCVMVVANAVEDPRFGNSTMVQGPPGIRFYAGAPLATHEGLQIGTLCIIDTKPRPGFTLEQQGLLRGLADTVMDEFELRLTAISAARTQARSAEVAQQLADVTDRLRLSNDTLEKVLEMLPVGVWIADREGNIIHGNPAARAIWGGGAYVPLERYDEYQAWSAETGQRIPADHWAMARAIREGAVTLGEVIHIRTFDGKAKIILNSAIPLRGPAGEITGAIAVNEEITERQRAEETLRQTRDELESIIDASPIAIASVDSAGNVRRWSRAAERLFGWGHDEVIGRPLPTVPSGMASELERNTTRVRRGESLQDVETTRQRKDGSLVEVSLTAGSLHGRDGESDGCLAMYADRTQRVAAERALRDSEERYRNLVEHSPNAIVVYAAGRIVYVNPAAVELFGASSAAGLCGRKPLEFIPPESLDVLRTHARRVLEENAPAPLTETRLRKLDGAPVDVEVISLPLRFEGTNAIQVVMRDIGDRKQAELRARANERNLAVLADNLPAFVAIKDRDSRYVIANRKFCEAVGCTADEVRGKTDFDFFTAEVARRQRQNDLSVMQSGRRLYLEQNTAFPHRPRMETGVILAPLAAEGGEIGGLIALTFDLTEKKAMEAEIRRTEDWFRRAIRNAPFPVMIHAEDGRILKVNDAWLELSGYSAADLATVEDWILKARGEEAPAARQAFRELYSLQSRSAGCEVSIRTHTGKTRTWVLTSAPLGEAPGGSRVVITMAMDVTERRNLEQQLAQAQKMEAIGQLAGGVAHDFNNLLTVIAGYAALLTQALPEDGPDRMNAHEIARAAERASSLTRQLLAFSRKQVLQPANVDINSLIREAGKILKRLIAEDIEIRLALSTHDLRALVDAGQLMQVVMNLAVNARDAMREGGVLTIATRAVELSQEYADLHPEASAGSYVEVAISDTGCGIERAALPRIFEPFFTTKGPGSGTGLGLSMVYGIVRQSNGHVEVQSEPGQGSTFRVYLPRVFAAAPAPSGPPAGSLRGTETVLVVEDEPALRKLASSILSTSGYHVVEAGDGPAALEICEQPGGDFALMVTDVVMPGMSGRELAARLAVVRPAMKVLYISGYTDHAAFANRSPEDEVNFLQKPFTAESLKQRVREILDRKEPTG